MKVSSFGILTLISAILSSASSATSNSAHENFVQCLWNHSNASIPIYTPDNSSYTSVLQASIRNRRFSTPGAPKPVLIATPLQESHVQAVVICFRKYGLHIRIRSGGHDYEGISYASRTPFAILDLINLTSINVDAEDGTAWVQAGATIGKLYYSIAEKSSTYAFPAGVCPTIGIGGHFSGGGYSFLSRKYGLAADNVVDARVVNADGELIDRKSMGEDLFWAIRGGGGGSFGVVLSWKVKLVPVPAIVTVFKCNRNLEQGTNALVQRWQYIADKLPEELFIRIVINSVNSTPNGKEKTIQVSFQALFLGKVDELIRITEQRFPELGVKRDDCMEMRWIQAVLYFTDFPIDRPLDVLLSRKPQTLNYFKSKSDYVTEPISELGFEGLWKLVSEEYGNELILNPYGGKMSEIPASSIPFPHRQGNIYKIQYLTYWNGRNAQYRVHIDWMRRLYEYMAPYVSKSPRAAYINYRDLDLGQSQNGTASHAEAKTWGEKYFKNNFDRLVDVKSKVDPDNFFRNEQSIPVWERKIRRDVKYKERKIQR